MTTRKQTEAQQNKTARPLRGADQASSKPANIDEYLKLVTDPRKRTVLQKLRETISAAVPQAEECLSYGLAAFRLEGHPLVAFGASQHHCAFYPMSASIVEAHQAELKAYDTSKGTIRFQPENPLPPSLLRKMVEARVAEQASRSR